MVISGIVKLVTHTPLAKQVCIEANPNIYPNREVIEFVVLALFFIFLIRQATDTANKTRNMYESITTDTGEYGVRKGLITRK